MIIKNFFLILIIAPFFVFAQNEIKGKIVDENLQPLPNASIYWLNSNIGTTSKLNGEFIIQKTNSEQNQLIISFIGYHSDTIEVLNNKKSIITSLKKTETLNTVKITENSSGIYIDRYQAEKIETITATELTKAACCELAGCFETQMSVQPKTTNIILDSKELSLLGLSGVYNQILIDGNPIISGLNYTYGISSIPGTIINKISISQGLASVQQGSNSITGQINIALKEYNKDETFFLNLYYNSFGAKQANVDFNFSTGKWKSIISLHTTQPSRKIDNNNDSFLDIPQTKKYSLYNKWIFGNTNEGLYTTTIIRFLNEQRIGGQINFNITENKGSSYIYGQVVEFQQPELYNKTSYKFNETRAITIETGISYHNQESFFGTTQYLANQTNYNIKIANILNWKTHKLVSGINYTRFNLNENIFFNENFTFNKTYQGIPKDEKIKSFFTENTFNWKSNNLQLITGIRADQHNEFGLFIIPRGLVKYNFSENSIIRFSIGSGWRTFNLFSEHTHLLASNKNIIIDENLKPEKAINYGLNILQAFYFDNLEMQITLDFYKTDFSNQIHPDYHHNPIEIHVHNFDGNSKSNSFQIEIALELIDELGIKLAYNYLDIFKLYENENKYSLPLTSKHHLLNTISYRPVDKNWYFDMNTHFVGKKKLTDTTLNPPTHQRSLYSDPFWIVNGQFTIKLPKSKLDIYIGCENIINYTQENPIISWQNPFGQYFDISNIWGPTKGREFYVGIRKSIT
tara:strand:- start:18295 stop:20529 length:2235 start_codon:yes stop_codon:yes gene_type:complete